MQYFSPTFIEYFSQLRSNNNTAWFARNRRWYEKEVREPFFMLIDELIVRLRRIDPDIQLEPSEAVFRINNDIRYAQEKIPYKTWMSAHISAIGKKSKEFPGFFIQANDQMFMISGGVYAPDKESLHQVRQTIAREATAFRLAISEPAFIETFGTLQGEFSKILPPEFRETALQLPEIALKQFHYRKELAPELILEDRLPERLLEHFETATGLHRLLKKAFKLALAA